MLVTRRLLPEDSQEVATPPAFTTHHLPRLPAPSPRGELAYKLRDPWAYRHTCSGYPANVRRTAADASAVVGWTGTGDDTTSRVLGSRAASPESALPGDLAST